MSKKRLSKQETELRPFDCNPGEIAEFDIPDGTKEFRIEPPPGQTALYCLTPDDMGIVQVTICASEEVAACRMMMRGTPEEREFASRNHTPKLVRHVLWEIEAEQGKDATDVLTFGAFEG